MVSNLMRSCLIFLKLKLNLYYIRLVLFFSPILSLFIHMLLIEISIMSKIFSYRTIDYKKANQREREREKKYRQTARERNTGGQRERERDRAHMPFSICASHNALGQVSTSASTRSYKRPPERPISITSQQHRLYRPTQVVIGHMPLCYGRLA